MSNKLFKSDGRIVNPFSQPMLTLVIGDKGEVNLQTPMPPKDACKALFNVAVEVMFQYIEEANKNQQRQQQPEEQQVGNTDS